MNVTLAHFDFISDSEFSHKTFKYGKHNRHRRANEFLTAVLSIEKTQTWDFLEFPQETWEPPPSHRLPQYNGHLALAIILHLFDFSRF